MTENLHGQTPQSASGDAQVPAHPQPTAYHAAYGVNPPEPQQGHAAPTSSLPAQPHQPVASAPHAAASAPQAHASAAGAHMGPAHEAHPASGAVAKKGSGAKTFLIAFAGALVACLLAFGVAAALGFGGGRAGDVSLGASTAGSIEATEAEASLAEAVADKCLPSVASITVYSEGAASTGNPLYDYFNGGSSNGGESESGLGSGVVLSADGYIITNNHVVSGGTRFAVTIEGNTYEADLVGSDASSDIAIIKVKDVTDLKPIEVADSDDITIGEWVMSIGSPFGLEQSVATGIISATSRSQVMDASQYTGGSSEIVIYPNLIQTDAAINPGNSGGALVDQNGQLVGINTLITSYSGNYSGVGFAIPSNYAVGLAKDIISGKEPTHAQLGVSLSNINPSIAERYGFSADEGAYVSAVTEGSGAANAGIQKGDIITGFDGLEVSSASDLMMDVRTKAPGDTVTITVNRDGEVLELQVTLGSDEASQRAKAEQQQQQQQQNSGRSGSGAIDPYGLFGN